MSKRKEDQPETNDGAEEAADVEPPVKRSRGRPKSVNPPKEKDPNVPKRSRGRPPKKAEVDDGDEKPAAEAPKAKAKPKQGKVVITKGAKRGRGRPKGSSKAKGRGRPPKAAKQAEEEAPEEEEEAGEAEESS